MKPYALKRGEGRIYDWSGARFTIKAGSAETEGALAFMEFVTRKGEEPEPHVHHDDDEIFYVLDGALTFTCAGETLPALEGAFVFLPRGIEHGYTIESDGDVRLLLLSTPAGFGDHVESSGTRID
jgi:quercetin dioxygenase-like cupin family protein